MKPVFEKELKRTVDCFMGILQIPMDGLDGLIIANLLGTTTPNHQQSGFEHSSEPWDQKHPPEFVPGCMSMSWPNSQIAEGLSDIYLEQSVNQPSCGLVIIFPRSIQVSYPVTSPIDSYFFWWSGSALSPSKYQVFGGAWEVCTARLFRRRHLGKNTARFAVKPRYARKPRVKNHGTKHFSTFNILQTTKVKDVSKEIWTWIWARLKPQNRFSWPTATARRAAVIAVKVSGTTVGSSPSWSAQISW